MGKVEKGIKCNVTGCSDTAVRSLAAEKASKAGLKVGNSKRAYLCKNHYKELKKKSRKERLLERWRMGS